MPPNVRFIALETGFYLFAIIGFVLTKQVPFNVATCLALFDEEVFFLAAAHNHMSPN